MKQHLDRIADYSKVVIFGCGGVGSEVYKHLKCEVNNVFISICDNHKKGEEYFGIEVISPEDACARYPDALFIIGSELYCDEMISQLRDIGIDDDNILSDLTLTLKYLRTTARQYLQKVDYHITEHCNLKCASCNHFSNIAEEHFADINEFRSTFGRFAEIMGDKLEGLILLGGEPLLHPMINQFLVSARNLMPKGYITLYTNGMLLKQMPQGFWNACRHSDIVLSISVYPIRLDIAEISQIAGRQGVRLSFLVRESWFKDALDLEGKQDVLSSFSRCGQANGCSQLKNGRLFPCSVAAGIEHFNKAFSESLSPCEKDSLDVFSDISPQKVLEFLASPIPFCRFCNKDAIEIHPWKLTDCSIEEYLPR